MNIPMGLGMVKVKNLFNNQFQAGNCMHDTLNSKS
jgi:hypothetical protein